MILLSWFTLRVFLIAVAILSGSVIALRTSRGWSKVWRLLTVTASLPVFAVSGLSLIFLVFASGCDTNLRPQYSPNGKAAAQITQMDWGGVGGNSSVDLFQAHGFVQYLIYRDDFMGLSQGDIHWLSDSEILIKTNDQTAICADAPGIKVRCEYRSY